MKFRFLLALSLFAAILVFPSVAEAKPSSACWEDYPNVGGSPQVIPGFPDNNSFSNSECVADADTCTKAGKVAAPGGAQGCPSGICCLTPTKALGCYNDYVGEDRTKFTSATCVKDDAACPSPNKKIGEGHGCSTAAPICCAALSGSTASKSGTSGAAIPQTGSTAEWKLGVEGGLQLVPCTKDGNCEIADLVQQGINFAKWLMGLSGALFLIVFVYGGAMYLASFGKSDYVKKGQTAMVRGAFGIVLVMGAWTIVSYVATSLGYTGAGLGASGGAEDKDAPCAKQHPGHVCMNVTPEQEKSEYVCYKSLCQSKPTDKQYKCCIQAPTNK